MKGHQKERLDAILGETDSYFQEPPPKFCPAFATGGAWRSVFSSAKTTHPPRASRHWTRPSTAAGLATPARRCWGGCRSVLRSPCGKRRVWVKTNGISFWLATHFRLCFSDWEVHWERFGFDPWPHEFGSLERGAERATGVDGMLLGSGAGTEALQVRVEIGVRRSRTHFFGPGSAGPTRATRCARNLTEQKLASC